MRGRIIFGRSLRPCWTGFLSILWEWFACCATRTIEILARIVPYPRSKLPVPMIVYIFLSDLGRQKLNSDWA